MSDDAVCVCFPKTADALWREYVVKNGQSAITPGEIPEGDTYIISVNYVKVCLSGQTTRIFNSRKLCRNYQHMMVLKHSVEQALCLPNNQIFHDIDKPKNLAKTVTVE